MNKDKEAESPVKKVSKTNIVVKGGILKEPIKIQEATCTVCFDDFIEEDEGLSSKVSKLSIPTKYNNILIYLDTSNKLSQKNECRM